MSKLLDLSTRPAGSDARWEAFGYGDEWVVEEHLPNSFRRVAVTANQADAVLIAAMYRMLPALLAAVAEARVALAALDDGTTNGTADLRHALAALEAE